MLIVISIPTFIFGPMFLNLTENGVAPVTAFWLRLWAGIVLLAVLFGCWILSDFIFYRALIGVLVFSQIHRMWIRLLTICLPREIDSNASNLAWWDGRWYKLGIRSIWAPLREYLCKVIEMSAFTMDIFISHIILFMLFPFTLIRYIDDLHSRLSMSKS
jgi:1,3-beta-glucan synthase